MSSFAFLRGRLTLCLGLLGVVSCVQPSRYNVTYSGYTAQVDTTIRRGQRFFVVPNKSMENQLLEAEVRGRLTRELGERGYIASSLDSADVVLIAAYGIGQPTQVSVNIPVYRPGQTSTVTGPTGATVATVRSSGSVGTIPSSRTEYFRWLTVMGADGKALRSGEVRSVWQGEATSSGSSSDLRIVLNYLLLPTLENFGINTRRAIQLDISEKDRRVAAISRF